MSHFGRLGVAGHPRHLLAPRPQSTSASVSELLPYACRTERKGDSRRRSEIDGGAGEDGKQERHLVLAQALPSLPSRGRSLHYMAPLEPDAALFAEMRGRIDEEICKLDEERVSSSARRMRLCVAITMLIASQISSDGGIDLHEMKLNLLMEKKRGGSKQKKHLKTGKHNGRS